MKVFTTSTSSNGDYQTANLTIETGYKIISGGGRMAGGDILMVESYPVDETTWITTHSDHVVDTLGESAAYAIGLYDPNDEWDVSIFSAESTSSASPSVSVSVPDGYLMTGGGIQVTSSDSGVGIVLIGSYPSGNDTWTAVGNQHINPGTGKVKAYAIGLKHRTFFCLLDCAISMLESNPPAQHPTVTITRTDPIIIGGGALGTPPHNSTIHAGNCLIDTYPGVTDGTNWVAKAKDHMLIQFDRVTAYAIECPNININFV